MRGYNSLSTCQYFAEEQTNGFGLIHFVYEPEPFDCAEFEKADTCSVYLVTEGEGELRTAYGAQRLGRGDFFFLFPEKPYRFASPGGWKLIYLSFRGTAVKKLYGALGISYESCVRRGYAALVREWLKEFNRSRANRHAALVAQALLLKTLSYFDGAAATAADNDRRRSLADLLARYIDEHFAEPALSLKSLGEIFHFHPNYISYTFKEYMGAGFASYLRQKRLYKACELLKSGALVKDAAFSVGFSDAFYFEQCFRKYIGVTPTEYREREKLAAKKRRKDDFASKFYM